MPDQNIHFTFKEIAEALIRQSGIKEGHWGIMLKFGLQGTNLSNAEKKDMIPAAIIPVLEIGLQRFPEPTPLSVDAKKVDAKPIALNKAESGKNLRAGKKPKTSHTS